MAAPSDLPTWATDTNYSGGPDIGSATRLEPTSGEKASGFIRQRRAPARKFNWIVGLLCDWVGHFNTIVNAAIDPAGGGEWIYVDDDGAADPRARVSRFFASNFVARASASMSPGSAAGSTDLETNSGFYDIIVRVPPGATINSLRVLVQPGAARAGANRMQFTFQDRNGVSFDTPNQGSSNTIATASDDGTTNVQSVNMTSIGYTVTQDRPLLLNVQAGNTAGASNDTVFCIQVEWTDPGPRGY